MTFLTPLPILIRNLQNLRDSIFTIRPTKQPQHLTSEKNRERRFPQQPPHPKPTRAAPHRARSRHYPQNHTQDPQWQKIKPDLEGKTGTRMREQLPSVVQ